MGRLPLIFALGLLLASPATATQFWISPYGPALGALGSIPPANAASVPTFYNFVNQTSGSLYIWAKPDATKTLKNWSLRLESKNAGNVIKFTNSHVYNPFLTGPDPNDVRWEYTIQPTVDAAISGEFMGFTLTNIDHTGKGIGPSTFADDPYYFGPLDGSGSWLLAKVDYKALNVVGMTDLFLQIGRLGLNSVGQTAAQTTVVFGHGGDIAIDPNNGSNRLKSIGAADAKVQVLATPDADFDGDGYASGLDFLIWQRFQNSGHITNDKGNATYLVDNNIDAVDLAAWEFQYGMPVAIGPLSGSIQTVPEPATSSLGIAFVVSIGLFISRRNSMRWKMKLKLLAIVVGLVSSTWSFDTAHAALRLWDSAAGGSFSDPNNWQPQIVPGPSDTAQFALPSTYAVTFPAGAFSQSLIVSEGNVTFSMGGADYTLDAAEIGGLGAPASLTLNSGSLHANGPVTVLAGGVLRGNGEIDTTSQLLILSDGELGGSLLIDGGPALNFGLVAPGDSSIGTLFFNATFENQTSGTLEIEINDSGNPGTDYDLLFPALGATISGGRLNAPLGAGYEPAVGHTIDFLQGGGAIGAFDVMTVPGFATPGVAAQFNITPLGAALEFVMPTTEGMIENPAPRSWGNATTWFGGVPSSTDAVTLISSAPYSTRVSLDLMSQTSQRAFAHTVTLSSLFPITPVTLAIPEGTSLSALQHVTVGANGILEITGGDVFTNRVEVDGGGQVTGNGRISGDLVLGDGGGGAATLTVNSFGSPAGVLRVEQDLTINSEGVVAIGIQDELNFGQVAVDGFATLGGRLVIDITALNPGTPTGTVFDIVLGDNVDGNFTRVETIGAGRTKFLAPADALSPLGECDLEALVMCEDNSYVSLHDMGDMNFDGLVTDADAADFVEGLLTPFTYENNHCYVPATSAGDFSGDGRFDFDDIALFALEVETLSAADIFQLIAEYSVPEPATGGLLLLFLGFAGVSRSPWRLRGSHR